MGGSTMSGSLPSYQGGSTLAVAKAAAPDFVIKYEPINEPTQPGGLEALIHGGEGEVITAVRDLIESGRTTPSRIQIYANMRPVLDVSVQFAPQANPSTLMSCPEVKRLLEEGLA